MGKAESIFLRWLSAFSGDEKLEGGFLLPPSPLSEAEYNSVELSAFEIERRERERRGGGGRRKVKAGGRGLTPLSFFSSR